MRVPEWISRPGDRAPPSLIEIARQLALALAPGTYAHCLAVRDHASDLARPFSVDPGSCALAGLLHDCAKNLSASQQLLAARAEGLELVEAELASPKVLHQRLGAAFAFGRYGVSDPAILAAIACHTTGQGDMDGLARCLFVADYTSPDRVFEGVGGLRAALDEGPEAAFRAVLAFKRELTRNRGLPEHPWAAAAYTRFL